MAFLKRYAKNKLKRQPTKGSRGLKNAKKLSWKKLAMIVLPIALIGGFLVYKSNASSNYTFVRNYADLIGGDSVEKKADGRGYVVIVGDPKHDYYLPRSMVDAVVSSRESQTSDRVCTYFTVLSVPATISIAAIHGSQQVGGGDYVGYPAEQTYRSPGQYNLCSKTFRRYAGYISVSARSGKVGVYSVYGKPSPYRSAEASCSLTTAQSTGGYTATWSSKGIIAADAEEPLTMRLKNLATGTETPDLPLSGSRALTPKAGVNNIYTLTLYEGATATDLSCTATITLGSNNTPGATPTCSLSIAKTGTTYTASWSTTNVPSGANWGTMLSRPGGNVSFQPTAGTAVIAPPTGTTTYTSIVFDKNISSTGAQNSWKTSCAANVTK